MVFENGVKNIQAAAYNGACTVYVLPCFHSSIAGDRSSDNMYYSLRMIHTYSLILTQPKPNPNLTQT